VVAGLEPPVVAGPGTLPDDLLALAGARNVFCDAPSPWFRPATETLYARRIDRVIWPVGGDLPPIDELPRDSPWLRVPAVRDGRVVEVDADLVHEAGPHVAEAALRIFRLLHADSSASLSKGSTR